MNNNIHIKKATESDLQEIVDLLHQVWDETYTVMIPNHIIEHIKSDWLTAEKINEQISNNNIIFNIATNSEKIIGVLTADCSAEKCHLNRLYILSDYQRNGIGKQLLNSLINNYRFDEVEIFVEEENKKAINFYKKQNFIEIDRDKVVVEDFEILCLKMVLTNNNTSA